jgi:hypothetical protein
VSTVLDIAGPVQAEVFVLRLVDGRIHLTGPCGPAPWYVEVHEGEDPLATVVEVARRNLGSLVVAHSTSWRRARDAVVLSFVVVVDQSVFESAPVERSELARSGAVSSPEAIAFVQVLEHALRHLSWLAREDEAVRTALPYAWGAALEAYTPEPFRNM